MVLDCSNKYRGTSLNDQLLQGPDLTNSLVGVLTRFRQEPVAFMADIGTSLNDQLLQGCANYALRKTAANNENEYGKEVAHAMRRNFYVDDCLRSVDTEGNATIQIDRLRHVCAKGGFRLTKFISNSRSVIESIPENERSKDVKTLDLNYDDLPIERALGVQWCVESDTFNFRITIKDKPLTRRGIL